MEPQLAQREQEEALGGIQEKPSLFQEPPNELLEGLKPKLAPALRSCWEQMPTLKSALVHESVPSGETHYQDYLIGELYPIKKGWQTSRRVTLRPVNTEVMKSVSEFIENHKTVELEAVISAFKDRKNDFKRIRYSLLKSVYPEARSTNLCDDAPEGKLVFPNVFTVRVLKELVVQTKARCVATAEKLHSNPQNLLQAYTDSWETFFLSALEISSHLAPLADVMNEASNKLLPPLPYKTPKFSIWRVLVGVFCSFCYLPLRQDLRHSLWHMLKETSAKLLQYQAVSGAKPQPNMTAEALMSYLTAAAPSASSNPHLLLEDVVNEEALKLQRYFQAMLDMSVNEITVHYINYKPYVPHLCEPFKAELRQILKEICEAAAAAHGHTVALIPLLLEERNFVTGILAPWLWDTTDTAIHEYIISLLKIDVLVQLSAFAALSPEEKKAHATGYKGYTEDKYLVPISYARNDSGKRFLKDDDCKRFVAYLRKNCLPLVTQYIEHMQALEKAARNEKRVEDIEIEIKNRTLGFALLPETNEHFSFTGVSSTLLKTIS